MFWFGPIDRWLIDCSLTLWHSCTILWAILSNILAVWQKLTCSVRERPLYQSLPAVQLKITSSYDSHRINLYSEECCPQYNEKDMSEQCSLSFDFRGIRGVCRWNSPQSLHNPKLCFPSISMLLHGSNTATLAFGLSDSCCKYRREKDKAVGDERGWDIKPPLPSDLFFTD